MKGQSDTVGSCEDEIRRYLPAQSIEMVTKNFHEADAELHELQLTIDDKVPRECLAEACYPHTKVRCFSGEWTESGRDHIEIVVYVGILLSAVTFRSNAVSATTSNRLWLPFILLHG